MARIRTIKPDFFRHVGLYDAEKQAGLPLRVAYAGLWTAADREGRFKWEPKVLKLDCLPYDEVDFSAVLDALQERGFIVKYEVDGRHYGAIPSWLDHQHINQREAQSHLPAPADGATCAHVQAPSENSQVPRGVNVPGPLRETVLARDGRKCVRCESRDDLTVDHIFPQVIGGTHALNNLRTLCRACNSARPVAGDALVEDLARDGLSLADMPSMCMHVQDRGEGKGREQEGKGRERTKRRVTDASAGGQTFERFWEAYPKRGTAANPKKPARDKFDRLVRDGADPEVMIAAAKRFCAIEREAGRYGTEKVAQAITWLNQCRYADYAENAPARPTGPPAPGLPSDEDLRRKYARTDEGPRASMAGDAGQDQESGSAPVFPGGEGVHRGERPAVCVGAGNGGMRGLGEILRSHRLVPGGIPGDAGSDPGRGEADDDGPGSVAGMV